MNPRPFVAQPRRRFALNPQFQEDFGRFLQDAPARSRAVGLAVLPTLALFAFWPAEPVLALNTSGLPFIAVGWVMVAVVSYLGWVRGIRHRAGGGAYGVQEWAAFVPLSPRRYLLGTLAGCLAEPLLFASVAMPLLFPAAALEGAAPSHIGAGMAVVVLAAVSARLGALCLQLYCGHRPRTMALLAHGGLVAMLLGTWAAWPPLSPLAAIMAAGETAPRALDWLTEPWPGVIVAHGALWLILYAACHARLQRLRARQAE